jgi:hypothetical protein
MKFTRYTCYLRTVSLERTPLTNIVYKPHTKKLRLLVSDHSTRQVTRSTMCLNANLIAQVQVNPNTLRIYTLLT